MAMGCECPGSKLQFLYLHDVILLSQWSDMGVCSSVPSLLSVLNRQNFPPVLDPMYPPTPASTPPPAALYPFPLKTATSNGFDRGC